MTQGRVHQVLQAASGWEDAHLHRFTALEPFCAAAAGRWRDSR
ncbi:IS1096 element passenger TnpR family protein [Pseudarthrobacter sp. BRE9]|nr:hypothetical protein [Pseudarthrobacter sp. BRE9]MDT0169454.1 hypothetical protein [Pseudarthrobacter sp. BRE9]